MGGCRLSALPNSRPRFALEDAEVVRLGEGGLVVRDGFLGHRLALACAQAARGLEAQGALFPAGMGRRREHRPDLRGDHTAWLTEPTLPRPLRALWTAFEALRQELNTSAWLGLRAFDLQLSGFPVGARYAPHVDTFAGDPTRRLTAICYLNPGWLPEHGGELVAGTRGNRTEVLPGLDRVVLFLSARVSHEVRPALMPRFAVTAWYRGAEAVLGPVTGR